MPTKRDKKGSAQKKQTAKGSATEKTVVKNPTKERRVVEPNSLEACAKILANKGKIEKARRTAEGIKDEKIKAEVLKEISSVEKALS